MKHDSPHRWHIPMLAWGGAFVVVGCSALLGLLAWNTTETYQQQSRWERQEALTLQAQAITKQLLHDINTNTASLQTLSTSISPAIQGKRLQRALRRLPWLWHTVVLNRQLQLLYPCGLSFLAVLLVAALTGVTCPAHQQRNRHS